MWLAPFAFIISPCSVKTISDDARRMSVNDYSWIILNVSLISLNVKLNSKNFSNHCVIYDPKKEIGLAFVFSLFHCFRLTKWEFFFSFWIARDEWIRSSTKQQKKITGKLFITLVRNNRILFYIHCLISLVHLFPIDLSYRMRLFFSPSILVSIVIESLMDHCSWNA